MPKINYLKYFQRTTIAGSTAVLIPYEDHDQLLIKLGLGTHYFVKVPRPGDSEVIFSIFESSCHLLLPV